MKKEQQTHWEQQLKMVQIIYVNLFLMGLVVLIGSSPAAFLNQMTTYFSTLLLN